MSWESDRINILFIDDDDAFRQVTTEVLDCLGYEVKAVGSLASATIALQNAEAEEYDLVLSDLCISGDRDGLLVLDLLDSLGVEVPVIFISGSGYGEWMIPPGRSNRRIGFLRKPVTMSQLAAGIKSVCPGRALEPQAV